VDKVTDRLLPALLHRRDAVATLAEEPPTPSAAAEEEKTEAQVFPFPVAVPAPAPEPSVVEQHLNSLPPLEGDVERSALLYFGDFLTAWLRGWEDPNVFDQPDRVRLMEDLGSCRYARPILILAFQRLSLQRLVLDALAAVGWHPSVDSAEEVLNFAERLSGNLVQLAAPCGFPELVNTYDYTTRWRRTE